VYFKLHESNRKITEFFPFVEKQTGIVLISDLLQLLSHARNASGNLGVPIKTKLHFHQQVDTIFSHAMGLLGLILNVSFAFSSLHSLLTLHRTLVSWKMSLLRRILTLLMFVRLGTTSGNLYLLVIIVFPVNEIKIIVMLHIT
jgi:hypothetical protein